VFHTDIAKWIGTLHMLRWLYTYSSIFQTLLQVCLSRCCICSTHMLQVFYLHVACVQWFSSVFRCFCKCFRRMFHLFSFYTLQVLHLDISKVDRVLHMRCMWETGGGVSFPSGRRGPPQGRAKRRHRRVARAPRGHAKWGVKTDCNHGHPDVGVWLSVWTLAVPLLEGTLILDQGCCLINHFFLFYFEPLHTSPGVHAKCQPHRFSLPRQPRPLDCKQE
jgi:hypothetical protein